MAALSESKFGTYGVDVAVMFVVANRRGGTIFTIGRLCKRAGERHVCVYVCVCVCVCVRVVCLCV